MNRYVKLAAFLFLAVIALAASCKRTPEAPDAADGNGPVLSGGAAGGSEFSDVTDRKWCLAQVRLDSENIEIDKTEPVIFTLRFDAERVSGTAAPNRYFAPYTLGDNQALSIEQPAGTLMAALFEPEKLKEQEFYNYLLNVYRWNLANGNLELYSRGTDGAEAVLVFIPAE